MHEHTDVALNECGVFAVDIMDSKAVARAQLPLKARDTNNPDLFESIINHISWTQLTR